MRRPSHRKSRTPEARGGRVAGECVPGRRAALGRPEIPLRVSRHVKLRLESRIGYVDLVHEMAEGMARGMGFEKGTALNIGRAEREAVINATKHGNGMAAAQTIDVSIDREAVRSP